MGFGIKVDVPAPKVEVPKIEVPKVEVPKVDVGAAVSGAVSGASMAAAGAVASATAAVTGAASAVAGAVASATTAAASAASSLASVAGAIADVAVSFTGAIEDLVLEPHLQLDANASWGDTHFEKGPIWIRVALPRDKAKERTDLLHLYSGSGGFDEQKTISAFAEAGETTVDVLFEDAPMNETFSLEITRGDAPPRRLFADVAYGDLRKTRKRF